MGGATLTQGRPASAPAEYTNSRGVTYYLRSTVTKAGKHRLVASRTPEGDPVTALPEGYEFAENVNGQVSVRKAQTPVITEVELEVVRRALARAGCAMYRAEVRRKAIVIHQPSMWPGEMDEMFSSLLGIDGLAHLLSHVAEQHSTYMPLARLVLTDRGQRLFSVERRYFSGRDDSWLSLEWDMQLEHAARVVASHLGPRGPRDSFFEWV